MESGSRALVRNIISARGNTARQFIHEKHRYAESDRNKRQELYYRE